MDELELINEAKAGNKSALNSLLKDNLNILKGYVVKMVGDPYLAQDVIQDALLKAVLNINKFEPKAKFSTWLIKIATNVYRDYLRKNKSYELIEEGLVDKGKQVEDIVISNYEYKEILVTFFSSFVKKGVTAGFITVMITFLSAALINLNIIGKFMPYKLVQGANLFTLENYSYTIAFSIICSILFIIATIFNMNKVEVI